MRRPSEQLKRYLEGRIKAIKAGARGELSEDGSAVVVADGLGFSAFVSPEGDAFVRDNFDGEAGSCDRSIRGHIKALVAGTRNLPMLGELLPLRTPDAVTCESCSGEGWTSHGITETPFFLCHPCCGLGWKSPALCSDSADPDSAHL